MHPFIFSFLTLFLFEGCIVDVVDEVINVRASASGKGVVSASFDASQYRNNITISGGIDTLIADIGLSLMARNSDQAKHLAQNVRASWNPGPKTKLAITSGGSDNELISFDNISAQVPD